MTTNTCQTDEPRKETGRDYDAQNSEEEDFLSLRDIIFMILQHRWKIAVFVLLVTFLAGVFFLCSPRAYKAEGCLQVVSPGSANGRVDKNLFETTIISHLQRVHTAFIAKRVSAILRTKGIEIDVIKLRNNVKISRPPKSDLIQVVASASSPESAALIVRNWIRQYLDSVSENYITVALSRVCALLKNAQADVVGKRGVVNQIKSRSVGVDPLITISKAVDDQQLWKELAEDVKPESLKQLADIHIKGQEESSEYLTLMATLLRAEQQLASALAARDFYHEVKCILEAKEGSIGSSDTAQSSVSSENLSDAQRYVETVLGSKEIIQFGESAMVSECRGALKKTCLVFVVSLFLACFGAFMCEWCKGLLSSR